MAFDLLRLSGTGTISGPYQRRRAALESVFAGRRMSIPWVLCQSTTDPALVSPYDPIRGPVTGDSKGVLTSFHTGYERHLGP